MHSCTEFINWGYVGKGLRKLTPKHLSTSSFGDIDLKPLAITNNLSNIYYSIYESAMMKVFIKAHFRYFL